MMIIDIDLFKSINDEYGHAAGDKTLKRFARVIRDCFKEEQTDIGRWGGEEFVVVCYNRNLDETVKIADELRSTIADTSMTGSRNITCSIGVTEVRENDKYEDAFGRMDKALYNAKLSGRNRVEAG
ncbi:MAG: GGDEF domain-containing protein [Lachnospiraceae bacterium]|nr:GGDEF domain-containing protein [Lachnospiraceae bacterium]